MSLLSKPTLAAPRPATGLARAGWTYDLAPVFLVGCPRSGTTWLQAMLAELDVSWAEFRERKPGRKSLSRTELKKDVA